MAAEVVDDHEMREAQRDYLDFLDDDVSILLLHHCIGFQNKKSLLAVAGSHDGGYCFTLPCSVSYHIWKCIVESVD